MNKSKLASLIFALSALILVGFVLPKYQNLQVQKDILTQKKDKLELTKQGITNVAKLKIQYEQRLKDAEDLNIFLPDEVHKELIITSINKAVQESGMILSDLSINENQNNISGKYAEVDVKLSLSGTFEGSMTLLDKLEKSLRLYDLKKLSFNPSTDSSDMEVSFDIVTYKINDLK